MIHTPLSRLLFLLLIIGTFSVSCTKDPGDNTPTTEQMISAKTWKFSKATASGTDISSLIQACYKDNSLSFTKASPQNTGLLNEGSTKCNAADPQERSFTWVYDASFQKIIITGTGGAIAILPGGSNELTLVRISATEMVVSQNVTFAGSIQLVEVTLVP